jgi:predicted unusual protein kinase regulating ubiquinone biosynthesis (AarF/ABC1/UbiB family)
MPPARRSEFPPHRVASPRLPREGGLMASPPKSKLSRIARLGGLSSRVSGSYLGQRIKGAFQDEDTRRSALKKLHLENAERVVATMGNLKGAAMKVGQGIAQAVEGMNLPPEMVKVLSQLNDKAEPIEFSLIRSAVEHELEGALEDLFTDFDEEPLGTASLAQAHAARLPTGERVVVKVLHEGIEDSVDSDLSALRTMLVA